MNAIIISIGDEIITGLIPNSNAAFISEKLTNIGISVERITTVGDNEREIIRCFEEHFKRSDVLIITGGLGPTHDDITRTAVCSFFNLKLVQSADARRNVEQFLKQRARQWSDAAEDQTYIPEGAAVIPNQFGTAAGELIISSGKIFVVLPGVPYEMESMMNDFVIPYLLKQPSRKIILRRIFLTTGIAESELAKRLGPIHKQFDDLKVAYLPSPLGVRLRITVSGDNNEFCQQHLSVIENTIRSRIQEYIYGMDDEILEEVVGRILTEHKLKIAVAESCTGGLISHRLTNVPGSSVYFERGVITYSNTSKTEILKVPNNLIESCGAVSQEVAEAMACGVREVSGADIGLSTTGIAGPSGGSLEKPVGLVWIGYADWQGAIARKFLFGDGRIRVKERASQAALDLIRKKLLSIE
jgi:competence/damage-inducible protein CinA-like protein